MIAATTHEASLLLPARLKRRIRVLVGDEVLCELTPYDLTKARITYRFMPGRGGPGQGPGPA